MIKKLALSLLMGLMFYSACFADSPLVLTSSVDNNITVPVNGEQFITFTLSIDKESQAKHYLIKGLPNMSQLQPDGFVLKKDSCAATVLTGNKTCSITLVYTANVAHISYGKNVFPIEVVGVDNGQKISSNTIALNIIVTAVNVVSPLAVEATLNPNSDMHTRTQSAKSFELNNDSEQPVKILLGSYANDVTCAGSCTDLVNTNTGNFGLYLDTKINQSEPGSLKNCYADGTTNFEATLAPKAACSIYLVNLDSIHTSEFYTYKAVLYLNDLTNNHKITDLNYSYSITNK